MTDNSDHPTLDVGPDEDRQLGNPPPRPVPPVPSGGHAEERLQGATSPAPRTQIISDDATPADMAHTGGGEDIYSQPTMLLEGEADDRVPAWLVEVGTEHHGQLHPLYRNGTRIGRNRSNHIVVPDERMSREHAFVEVEDLGGSNVRCWLVDKESRLGTLVNGTRLASRQQLVNNDRITMGNTTLVFKQLPPARQGV